MSFPNRGEGGSPTWEKFPHFPVFFFGELPSGGKEEMALKAASLTPLRVESTWLHSHAREEERKSDFECGNV